MTETFFYSILHDKCSCRQKNGDLRDIGKLYKEYYKQITREEKAPIKVLNELDDGDGEIGLLRMCCRSRFLSIPIVPMIDRSKRRIYDDRKTDIVEFSTPDLEPGHQPLEFPMLDGAKALKIIPPKVKIQGELPEGF
jgi:DNA-directed RNA polymerase subunit N (RpoN/RPB10)